MFIRITRPVVASVFTDFTVLGCKVRQVPLMPGRLLQVLEQVDEDYLVVAGLGLAAVPHDAWAAATPFCGKFSVN